MGSNAVTQETDAAIGALHRIADAITTPGLTPTRTDGVLHIASLAEAVLQVAQAQRGIAAAISDLARSVRERK